MISGDLPETALRVSRLMPRTMSFRESSLAETVLKA